MRPRAGAGIKQGSVFLTYAVAVSVIRAATPNGRDLGGCGGGRVPVVVDGVEVAFRGAFRLPVANAQGAGTRIIWLIRRVWRNFARRYARPHHSN